MSLSEGDQRQYQQLATIYTQAFASFPWFENLSTEEVERRLTDQTSQPGHQKIIEVDDNDQVIAAIWYDTPSLDTLEQQRGLELGRFAATTLLNNKLSAIVWEREVLVAPSAQGRGLGTKMRRDMLQNLSEQSPDGALLLTRMRDDNTPIIHIAEKLDYQRTGIRMPSSQSSSFHEFWYRLIGAKS